MKNYSKSKNEKNSEIQKINPIQKSRKRTEIIQWNTNKNQITVLKYNKLLNYNHKMGSIVFGGGNLWGKGDLPGSPFIYNF